MNPEFAPAKVDIEHIPDGGLILRSPMELEPCAANLCSYLVDWAERATDRTFIAEQSATGEWRHLAYGDALASVRALAQGLLDHDVSEDRPLMILSENSIDNGLLQLAAMFVGLPVAPVSPAYSLMSQDLG
ncbi:MAG: AMP-binding protein, partial [Woeseiaceae bacterium]|nr:AMP-binding protein [Woeseiaceae bacterium]